MLSSQVRYQELQQKKWRDAKDIELGVRNADIAQQNADTNVTNASTNIRNAKTNEYNAKVNKQNADINARNADTNRMNYYVNKQNADTNYKNYQVNATNADTNRMNYYVNKQNADTNVRNAITNERNASTNEYNASTERMNYYVNKTNAETNKSNAVSQRIQAHAATSQAESAARQATVKENLQRSEKYKNYTSGSNYLSQAAGQTQFTVDETGASSSKYTGPIPETYGDKVKGFVEQGYSMEDAKKLANGEKLKKEGINNGKETIQWPPKYYQNSGERPKSQKQSSKQTRKHN